jgi:hypothetical protein
MEDNNRKYLKNIIKVYPALPTNPFIKININDNKTIIKNNILLK